MIIREQIIAAVRARLAALREVTLNSSAALAADGPINIEDLGQSIVEKDATTTTYLLNLDVEGAVVANDEDAASAEVNALYAAIVAAVLGGEQQLGLTFVESVDEGALQVRTSEGSDRPVSALTIGFDIQFIALSANPGVAP